MPKYREGDSEMSEEKPEETEMKKESQVGAEKHKGTEVPVTAFLITTYSDGRLEAVTELNNILMERKATPRDIRDLCTAMARDVDMILLSQLVQASFAQSIRASMENQIVQKVSMGDLKMPRH